MWACNILLWRLNMDKEYPHESGDVLVLGPECFIDAERKVISYQGVNYYKDEPQSNQKEPNKVIVEPGELTMSLSGDIKDKLEQ